jgi:hypothetical protein
MKQKTNHSLSQQIGVNENRYIDIKIFMKIYGTIMLDITNSLLNRKIEGT